MYSSSIYLFIYLLVYLFEYEAEISLIIYVSYCVLFISKQLKYFTFISVNYKDSGAVECPSIYKNLI